MEFDESTKRALKAIPLMRTKAGPRDGDSWVQVGIILLKFNLGQLMFSYQMDFHM